MRDFQISWQVCKATQWTDFTNHPESVILFPSANDKSFFYCWKKGNYYGKLLLLKTQKLMCNKKSNQPLLIVGLVLILMLETVSPQWWLALGLPNTPMRNFFNYKIQWIHCIILKPTDISGYLILHTSKTWGNSNKYSQLSDSWSYYEKRNPLLYIILLCGEIFHGDKLIFIGKILGNNNLLL